MIYITGDTHGIEDWEKLNVSRFPEQKTMDPSMDYLIILGDFGGVWGDEEDAYVQRIYNQRTFTTLFIDGNHENHDLLDKYPVEEWHGGKVHKICDRVIHLMRGQVFKLQGFTIFTMGGAESTDKQYRREGESWWARELPSDEEYEEALRNLSRVDFKVDIVLTHCAPEGYIRENIPVIFNSDLIGKPGSPMADIVDRSGNRLTDFFDSLITEHKLKFDRWYFGHYHRDIDWDNFSLMFNRVRVLVF